MADTTEVGRRVHPMVSEAKELLENGKMDRREFVRIAALLGVTAGAGSKSDSSSSVGSGCLWARIAGSICHRGNVVAHRSVSSAGAIFLLRTGSASARITDSFRASPRPRKSVFVTITGDSDSCGRSAAPADWRAAGK